MDTIDTTQEDFMKGLNLLAITLLVVGGLNWGLVGIAGFDLVAALFGEMSALSRAVYVLVGLAALYQGLTWRATQRGSAPAMAKI